MRAITIAIGKTGVNFFTEQLVVKELIKILAGLKPPDKEITIDKKIYYGYNYADNINIKLTQGKLNNFAPVFQGVSQQANGVFPLRLGENSFSAQYNWHESYKYTVCTYDSMTGSYDCNKPYDEDRTFPNYSPSFRNFSVTVPLQFQYNDQKKEWDIVALNSQAKPPDADANIPPETIIQAEYRQCFAAHVSDATAAAISSIDFGAAISQLLQGIVASIPASGDLGGGIQYDFSLGDDGLKFPGNDGIQMGVRGGASYKGTPFSGTTPPTLPLPAPLVDADAHHLNMYVSNYEVDALNWAYFKAGKLDKTVNPGDKDIVKDADVLKVKTYISEEPALGPYQAFGMQAQISPVDAPVTHFQMVWEFPTDPVMKKLKGLLPEEVYDLLSGIEGDAFTSKAELEKFLNDADVPAKHFQIIEDTSQRMGMVVTSNLKFKLIILGKEKPDIQFSVRRTDVLTDLRLGIGANNTQTMQYDFIKAGFEAKFISSTVPHFKGGDAFKGVWVRAGEPGYDAVMSDLGKTGVPLPIMADFQFNFSNAELSVQDGYVSILASVLYKNK